MLKRIKGITKSYSEKKFSDGMSWGSWDSLNNGGIWKELLVGNEYILRVNKCGGFNHL